MKHQYGVYCPFDPNDEAMIGLDGDTEAEAWGNLIEDYFDPRTTKLELKEMGYTVRYIPYET